MSNDVYAILYLIYGFTFILMGIYAVREYRKSYSIFPLMNAIVYLGVFGITHGFTEWLTMIQRAGLFEEYHPHIFVTGRVIKAFSFLSLMKFGFVLITNPSWRKITTAILIAYYLTFLFAVVFIIQREGINHLHTNRMFFIVSIRYMMAFPAAMLSTLALIYHGLKVRALDSLWMKYYFLLSGVVFFYGLFDGLFVRKHDFFPANTFYNQWFIEVLGIPNQIFKIIIGIAFYLSIRLVIRSFSWEREHKKTNLEAHEERLRKQGLLNQKLHDELIQTLYISGLNLESTLDKCSDNDTKQAMQNAIQTLNDTIDMLRYYIRSNMLKTKAIKDINYEINSMIENVFENTDIKVTFFDYLDEQDVYALDQELLEDLYYVLRELLVNTVKHSKATTVKINLHQEIKCLKLIVTDNGIGFTPRLSNENQYGLNYVQERVKKRHGSLKYHVKRKRSILPSGSTITVLIPLEVI